MDTDDELMARALGLARHGWGTTNPNPMVGALIVEAGEVVAEGWHAKDGGPHAERAALTALGRRPRPGATMVVTLEPCSTAGRTGACCDAIKAAGIARVVIGATDPNPAHAGRGARVLREAGIDVTDGVRAAECAELNLIFNHWITTGRPLIAAKIATTRDGFSRPAPGEDRWITGGVARADVHRWRRLFPAIATGAGTVAADDPALTRRWTDEATGEAREDCGVRFVFDSQLRTAAGPSEGWPRVYADRWCERTVVVAGAAADLDTERRLTEAGVRVWRQETTRGARGWAEFASRCAAERISGVYLEGGAELLADARSAGAATYGFWYRAPREAGAGWGGRVDWRLAEPVEERLGDDTLTRGKFL
ncbi:MAG: bifunctional diaminohydroxyphosphoribosylaminopyrimidine deaminase/5-amino-6-(5-phosphoribosylamino)uracil reductase RibD [Opitutaceae bacterium]|jgi:diaminohydroxyphosphoribosylaminopyrimidine deaminase/5-amino-6-(5-phosphoribosylamino)uracil reductase|nr:bifunctional diaminohydroxyphosphoribosylaminopyrimidine deaminase/5-amino-6-(5-phosphoribosylamino)uracil reductase RibD [Opitutaceae bacterium]